MPIFLVLGRMSAFLPIHLFAFSDFDVVNEFHNIFFEMFALCTKGFFSTVPSITSMYQNYSPVVVLNYK